MRNGSLVSVPFIMYSEMTSFVICFPQLFILLFFMIYANRVYLNQVVVGCNYFCISHYLKTSIYFSNLSSFVCSFSSRCLLMFLLIFACCNRHSYAIRTPE